MKPKVRILTLNLLLMTSGLAFAADKSVIIGFHQTPRLAEKTLIHRARGTILRSYQLVPAMAVRLPEEQIENLRKNARIAYVEENAIYQVARSFRTDQELAKSWGVCHIFADIAHASGNKGTGVKIAILDTGIDYTHKDLGINFRGGHDFVFNDNDPFDDSFDSHGTHVAGIIAAEENGMGVVGVAPEADLYAVKVLDGAGFGSEDWIIAGIEWAVQNGIEIINLSIEGPHRQGLQDACDHAYKAGVLLVAAGGNSMVGGGPVRYPAAYDSVIAVTAIDPSDNPGFFSPVDTKLELAAPGIDILSTGADGTYCFLSGTSQAAPHVTGTAALLILSNTKDVNGNGLIDNDDIRLTLQQSATDLGDVGKDAIYGYGLVNAARAAFASEIISTITRTSAPPGHDAERIRVAGMPYNITITNRGLNRVAVDVFEGNVLREDISKSYSFGNKIKPRYYKSRKERPDASFTLDATGARYHVLLTPYGRQGSSAKIVFKRVEE